MDDIPAPRSGSASLSALTTAAKVHSRLVAAVPEIATGGCAWQIDPFRVLISIARIKPAFIGIGGRIAPVAL